MPIKNLKDTLDGLIVALCADYDRREEIILGRMAQRRVDNELRYINFKIFDATAEIVGEGRAADFIREIGQRIGFVNAADHYMSEGTYKHYKALVKENLVRKLYLK